MCLVILVCVSSKLFLAWLECFRDFWHELMAEFTKLKYNIYFKIASQLNL